jgi:hypothetical protein
MKRMVHYTILFVITLSLVVPAQAQQPDPNNKGNAKENSSVDNSLNGLLAQAFRPKGMSLMPQERRPRPREGEFTAQAGEPIVIGTGTPGRLPKWIGRSGANFILGNSSMSEDASGNISVAGTVQATGGFKFPDGSVQTTSGLNKVIHDTTLKGDGTAASPLGVAVPLLLSTTLNADIGVVRVVNNSSGNSSIALDGESAGGTGVYGKSTNGVGVTGESTNNTGVIARGRVVGVFSVATGPFGTGVQGTGGPSGVGVKGIGGSGTDGAAGVEAFGGSGTNMGGAGVKATGAFGGSTAAGVGVIASGGGNISASGGTGVKAKGGNSASGFGGFGIDALGGDSDTNVAGDGVSAIGGSANVSGSGGAGLAGEGGTGRGAGKFGGIGIFSIGGLGLNGALDGPAALFEGDVIVDNGSLEVDGNFKATGTKMFKIDHPLDPENRYLYHAAIESSEVLNIYSGNVITDESGDAVVHLPEWFEALNKDFRYQLTVVGTFAQAIVADEIRSNRFSIKTSAAGVKVSWQVTGVRNDRGMRKHPFKAEEEKTEQERGHYLQPEAFDQPEERSIEWARNPELMQQLKQRRVEAEKRHKEQKANDR